MANAPATLQNVVTNLPELPPPLKHLSPYIQRALELKIKDPVMCYWCLYFSAKQGVAARGGKECRPFLLALMDVLERAKKELNSNDAVASDEAGSAYIENFAIRVFNNADNEDRKGKSSRSTAKKFLAAANFLELLSVFDIPEQPENEQKIRYSKWKAADIAKAIREGRGPTPGPAGSVFEETMKPPTPPSDSGTLSPPTIIAGQESVFGSIPPSISASPNHKGNFLTLPSGPHVGAGPNTIPLPPSVGTPSASPGLSVKGVSPERGSGGGSQGRISPLGLSPGDEKEKEKEKEVPRTPTPLSRVPFKSSGSGLGASIGSGNSVSPGAWSTAATPGQDESNWALASAVRPSTAAIPEELPIPGITGRLMERSPSPSKRPTGNAASSSSSGGSRSPTLRATASAPVTNESVRNANWKSYENVDSDHEKEMDGPNSMAVGRQDSWSSTAAQRGDSIPSRGSSWGQSWGTGDGDHDDVESDVPIPYRSGSLSAGFSRENSLSVIPETSSSGPSVVDADMQEDVHPAEASDLLSPLTQPQTISSFHTTTSSVPKRVHFTPSVVGGLSSIASESPPPSPRQSMLSVPLPSSNESDASDDTSRGGSLRKTGIPPIGELPSTDNMPSLTFTVPNGNGTPHLGASARLSPIIQTVSLHPNGGFAPGHNRSSSGGSSSSISRSNGNTPATPSLANHLQTSPRLNPEGVKGVNAIPPISAILPDVPSFPSISSPPMHLVSPPAPSFPPLLPQPPPTVPALPPVSSHYPPTPYPRHSAPPLPDVISPEDTAKAKKAAKYAINALDYDDLDTARKELVKALAILGVSVEL
ncbi:Vta1 like-domain-containing protein [Cantharellus anzutake]|uniref:Vta1 like-domain-containing protein n=1 Tax=Cantharellus anzutake TaxID=1750568 RepID=UPI001906E5A0|nr:Vta1 like-domain-containing protein [Cantharellus anzutake]KAF8321387.1 Vta1 like-domain-containing protein [Cantharellus anzutake]